MERRRAVRATFVSAQTVSVSTCGASCEERKALGWRGGDGRRGRGW